MATLVGFLILAIAAAVTLPNVLASRSRSVPSSSTNLMPGGINDPAIADLNSRLDGLAIAIGTAVGRGAGAGVGSAVSGAEVGVAHGIGANTLSDAEIDSIVRRASAAGAGSGSAVGTNAGELAGSGVGSSLASFPVAVVEGAFRGGGAAFDRLFRLADQIGFPKL